MKKLTLKQQAKLRKRLIKKLDSTCSLKVRERDKFCRKCRKAPASQAAHIFSRSNMATRWDLRNLLGMCFYCHLYWGHREPVEFTLWVKKELGEELFRELELLARSVKQWSINELEELLTHEKE